MEENPQSISFRAHPSFRSFILRLHLLPLHLQSSRSIVLFQLECCLYMLHIVLRNTIPI